MAKTTAQYWNVLADPHRDRWHALAGTDGLIEQLTLAVDEQSGDYTRLTRFHAGANTKAAGPQCHDYPEEIYIISGRLYDAAFDLWLEAGHYASRPPKRSLKVFQSRHFYRFHFLRYNSKFPKGGTRWRKPPPSTGMFWRTRTAIAGMPLQAPTA
jgi:hypothetical protein